MADTINTTTAPKTKAAPLIFALACAIGCAIGATPALAGSLDNCGTLESWANQNWVNQTSPHCRRQMTFCFSYLAEVRHIALFKGAPYNYSDPRDIAVMLDENPPQVLDTNALAQLIANVPKTAQTIFWGRIVDDCLTGTLDFIDNTEPP